MTSRGTPSPWTTGWTTCSGSWSRACRRTTHDGPNPAAGGRRSSTRSGAWTRTAASPRRRRRRRSSATVDLVMDRWARDPDLHVYHYAAYERTALGRLAQRYGTREEEVDRLLRGEVLVDLFRVVRQGLRAGVESYSIKKIEPLYALTREQDLKDAGSSIVAFETWLELGEDAPVEDAAKILDGIAAYNRDDVVSNWRLRDWLEERRLDLEAREGHALPRPTLDDGAASRELTDRERHVAELMERLTEGVPADPLERAQDPDGAGRWLLAQLLAWHRREDKSAWWRFFDLLRMTDEELIEEREPLAGLVPVGGPRAEKKSLVYTFSFPPQDHRIDVGSDVADPVTREGAGAVVALDETNRTIELKRGPKLEGTPLPTALVPTGVIPTTELAESLLRTGEQVAERGLLAGVRVRDEPDLGAARALLLRTPPGVSPGRGDRAAGRDAARRRGPPRASPRRPRPPGPGAAGLGQDVHGRAHDRSAGDGRAAGRRGRQQPQGHRQPAPYRGRGRARAAGEGRDRSTRAHRPEAEDGSKAVLRGRGTAPGQRLGGPGAAFGQLRRGGRGRLDLVPARDGPPGAGAGRAVRGRGGPDEPGQRDGLRARRPRDRPAGRPAAAGPADPGQPPAGGGAERAGPHPGGPGHHRARGGPVPGGDLAAPPGDLRLHLGRVLRGPPPADPGAGAAACRRRGRHAARGDGHAARPGRARGQRHGLGRGGGRGGGPGPRPAGRRAPRGRTATATSTRSAWATSSSSPRTTRMSPPSRRRSRRPAWRTRSWGPWTSSRARSGR